MKESGFLRIVFGVCFVIGCLGIAGRFESGTLYETSLQAEETAAKKPEWTAGQLEFFEKKVRPVFVEHCQDCHGDEEQEGEFRIDSRSAILQGGETGPAIIPGFPEKSELILAINHDPDGYQMPPEKKLSNNQIAAITQWVKQGAAWPKSPEAQQPQSVKNFSVETDHWSLQPVNRPTIPKVNQKQWSSSPVDQFILARLEQANLSPSSQANRAILARRLYFDLLGLPPSPKQLEQFVNDPAPDAYEQLVTQLLASPQYGERWGRHWLDLVRFAETLGHEFDYDISHTSHYRDYVIRAFNEDLPFDQFAMEHFAGDLIAHPRYRPVLQENESVLATGFFWFGQGKHSPVDVRAEQCDLIDNQIDVLSKAFLGTTIACARCHDHKFDPVSIKDYYALSGIMESSRRHYADIRKQEPLNETIHNIHELKQKYRARLIDYSSRQLQEFLTKLMLEESTVNWNEPALNQLEHPLYPWKQLRGFSNPKEFLTEKKRILDQFHKQEQQKSQTDQASTVFASFENGLPDRWGVHGQAFVEPMGEQETLITSSDPWKPVLSLPGKKMLHSGSASGRSYGVIRSPTFLIKESFIDYHICRSGGNRLVPNRHRGQLKNGHISLVIDGFQHIKNPIYGELSLQIKVAGQPVWQRQNVQKWVGHRAYIEIFDEEEGFLQIDQIRFSPQAEQAEQVVSSLVAMLKQKSINSAKTLKNGYHTLFLQVLEQYRLVSNETVSLDDDNRELLNWMLRQSKKNTMDMQRPDWLDQFYLQLKELESQLGQPKLALTTTEGSGINSPHLIRGNSKKPAEEIPRRFLEVFQKTDKQISDSSSGRLEVARSIVSDENPFFDRVIVNRIWEHHFGRGLVATPDDFGKMGIPPSHPGLLDYLAGEFRNHGRSIKWLHQFLVNTSTYRMRSDLRNDTIEKDPQNRLWHRMPIRRLEGEAIRDAVLAVSGGLQSTLYGPSIAPYLTPFMQGRGRPSRSGPLDGNGRRSVYINVRRNFLTPLFLAFDYPLPMTTTGKRSVSNVPAQALTMMNNQFGVQQANHWARSIVEGENNQSSDRIRRAYLQAYSREPTKPETDQITKFVTEETNAGRNEIDIWSDVCHILFNVKEFVFVR